MINIIIMIEIKKHIIAYHEEIIIEISKDMKNKEEADLNDEHYVG